MKTRQLIFAAVIALTATHAVYAQDASAPKTRAQVKAELAQARADGTLDLHNREGTYTEHFVSTKTRADVRAELDQARADGTLDRVNGNDYGVGLTELSAASAKSRAEVRAEVLKAVTAGQHLSQGERSRG